MWGWVGGLDRDLCQEEWDVLWGDREYGTEIGQSVVEVVCYINVPDSIELG